MRVWLCTSVHVSVCVFCVCARARTHTQKSVVLVFGDVLEAKSLLGTQASPATYGAAALEMVREVCRRQPVPGLAEPFVVVALGLGWPGIRGRAAPEPAFPFAIGRSF